MSSKLTNSSFSPRFRFIFFAHVHTFSYIIENGFTIISYFVEQERPLDMTYLNECLKICCNVTKTRSTHSTLYQQKLSMYLNQYSFQMTA